MSEIITNKCTDLYVYHGTEIMRATLDGYVYRPQIHMRPSGQWQIIGAVMLNNFGRTVHRYTWEEIKADPASIPWTHRNGKQQTHVIDLDHGTRRMWGSPGHRISKGS